nr:hypothetical protein [Tanacetum cinerariifolium]
MWWRKCRWCRCGSGFGGGKRKNRFIKGYVTRNDDFIGVKIKATIAKMIGSMSQKHGRRVNAPNTSTPSPLVAYTVYVPPGFPSVSAQLSVQPNYGVYYPQQGVQTLSGPPQGVHFVPGPSQPPVQFTTRVQQQQGGSFPGLAHLGQSPSMPFHPSQLFASGSQGNKKEYAGTLPNCNKCKLHHAGPCTVKCGNMGIRQAKTHTLRGEVFDETKAKVWLNQNPCSPSLPKLSCQGYLRLGNSTITSRILRSSLKPDRAIFAQSVAPSEITPPPCFSTLISIPDVSTSELPPITTFILASMTPENTPHSYRASTSANPNLMISLVFVEANYEILESLLRERQMQIRNKDICTELKYFSEEYNKERVMELRLEQNKETTLPLHMRSPRVRRKIEWMVGFEEAPNKEVGRIKRNVKGSGPSELRARENGSQGESSFTFGSTPRKKREWSSSAILFDLHIRRPPSFN